MKRCTLRWFSHIERMENEEFVKKVYRSSAEGTSRWGRPLGRWKDKVKEEREKGRKKWESRKVGILVSHKI